MVIDFTSTSSSIARGKVSPQKTEQADTATTSTSTAKQPSPKDTLELSSTAQALNKADDIINSTPDFDADKISQIKAAISDGSYSMNYQSIAEKMLNIESQLA